MSKTYETQGAPPPSLEEARNTPRQVMAPFLEAVNELLVGPLLDEDGSSAGAAAPSWP